MVKLISEQLPSDGGFHLHKLLKDANERLGKLGKHGKRAKLKQSGNSITLQFNFHGQKNPGCGCSFTKRGIQDAERIAELVTNQLSANSFTWDWFNALVGKEVKTEKEEKPTCKQLIIEYQTHWLKENKQLKNPLSCWQRRFRHLERVMGNDDTQLTSFTIKQIVEKTENNSPNRTYTLQALLMFLDYFDISDYHKLIQSYKAQNKPNPKKRNVPSDERIKEVFKNGFKPSVTANKKMLSRYPQWQFLYGLLATYGLRIHEAWNIANWDKPVILQKGDWIAVEINLDGDEDKYEQYKDSGTVVPAILDPSNKEKILCIKHATKTGYRMAMPISPQGENWIDKFNLIQPLNLPDIKNPLAIEGTLTRGFECSNQACRWFRARNYGFTPHDLRHAYNHRGHHLGYNPTTLSNSLGHSLQVNNSIYLKTMPDTRKMQMMTEAIASEKEKQSELEKLKAEVEFLKQENEKLKTENHLYKSLLEQIRLR
jgi:integrase